MVTSKWFKEQGFRMVPLNGTAMERNKKGKKQILLHGEVLNFSQSLPKAWTKFYGDTARDFPTSKLVGLICGPLYSKQSEEQEIIALDCDSEVAWNLLDLTNPEYQYKFKSVGKEGGTILYLLPEELRNLAQYSIKKNGFDFEYMSLRGSKVNAMVYLPTSANKTKKAIPESAVLEYPPLPLITLILQLAPKKEIASVISYDSTSTVSLPFNAPLVKQYVLEVKAGSAGGETVTSKVAEKVYKIFTPKAFRSCANYQDKGWIHPDDEGLQEAGSWPAYMVGLSAIAGADPSIDKELYLDFMQAINSQVSKPMGLERFNTEIVSPMVEGKSKIGGKVIWKYTNKWDEDSFTVINQRGETLEYFSLDGEANIFVEYNHEANRIVQIKGAENLRAQIYQRDATPEGARPGVEVVKKLKLVSLVNTYQLPTGVTINLDGHAVINDRKMLLPLKILREPENYESIDASITNIHVRAFNVFLDHLLNEDEDAILFMKQVISYHGKHLKSIPVILYLVGVGGAGKSHLGNFLSLLFGAEATVRPSAAQVKSQYNDWLIGCAILILTETNDAQARDIEGIKGILKTITGEDSVGIEAKYKALLGNIAIFCLPVVLANSLWYDPDENDRRLFSIAPRNTMRESALVSDFEQETSSQIVDIISSGIINGTISKYLSGFCPSVLPPVPLTDDKLEMSRNQADPIKAVQGMVASSDWAGLVDLLLEHKVTSYLEADLSNPKIGDYLFKGQLVELVEGMRIDQFHPTDKEISMAFTAKWFEGNQCSATFGNLGRTRWKARGLYTKYKEIQQIVNAKALGFDTAES